MTVSSSFKVLYFIQVAGTTCKCRSHQKGLLFFPSVPQNSSIPLRQRIRKIMKNSLKLLPLFFNPRCCYWEFQVEFIHMSGAWDWIVSSLKSYIFFIILLPPFLNTSVNMLPKLCWTVYNTDSLNSSLRLSFSQQGRLLNAPLCLF